MAAAYTAVVAGSPVAVAVAYMPAAAHVEPAHTQLAGTHAEPLVEASFAAGHNHAELLHRAAVGTVDGVGIGLEPPVGAGSPEGWGGTDG